MRRDLNPGFFRTTYGTFATRPGLLRRAAALVVCVLAAGCERSADPDAPAAAPRRPNILLVLIDTLRADRLGSYGNPSRPTPTMDAIASEGVRFDDVFAAAPWTLPSVASLFTSYYPSVHKVTDYRLAAAAARSGEASVAVLSDEFDTLAEVLKRSGYETAAVSANKFVQPQFGFGQGFDAFEGDFVDNHVSGALVNEAALRWLDARAGDKPFFLYLHYMDVHGPYDADPRFMDPRLAAVAQKPNKRALTRDEFNNINQYLHTPPKGASDPALHERLSPYMEYWTARYEAGVAQMDFNLGQLRDALAQRGLWEESLVIVTSDHGEAFCEHKEPGFERVGWWDHGYSLYQTQLHVPLLMRWPDQVRAGAVVRGNAQLTDLFPTLADLLGIAGTQGLQGRSLRTAIRRGTVEPGAVFAETIKVPQPEMYALVDGAWKFIRVDYRGRPVAMHLFNLEADPGEQNDLFPRQAQRAQAMNDAVERQRAANRTTKPALVTSRAAAPGNLAALGYIAQPAEDDDEPPAASQPTSASRPTGVDTP